MEVEEADSISFCVAVTKECGNLFVGFAIVSKLGRGVVVGISVWSS